MLDPMEPGAASWHQSRSPPLTNCGCGRGHAGLARARERKGTKSGKPIGRARIAATREAANPRSSGERQRHPQDGARVWRRQQRGPANQSRNGASLNWRASVPRFRPQRDSALPTKLNQRILSQTSAICGCPLNQKMAAREARGGEAQLNNRYHKSAKGVTPCSRKISRSRYARNILLYLVSLCSSHQYSSWSRALSPTRLPVILKHGT